MGILSRSVFRQILVSATLGTILFTFVLFLRGARSLFELLVRSSAAESTVAYLFSLVLPGALGFTIPVGLLAGTLLALSRMSADGEIVALRACGIPSRHLARPVLAFAAICFLITAAMTCVVTPWSLRETLRIAEKLAAEQLTGDLQPRVFDERFPRTILYVGDVRSGTSDQWRYVFLGDTTPPAERKGGQDQPDAPRITVATEAVPVPDPSRNRVQLVLKDARTLEVGKDQTYNIIAVPLVNQTLEAQRPERITRRPYRMMDMGPLYREIRPSVDARIEFHQRLALPFACFVLALVGLSLGISSRKGGKSGAFVATIAVALGYYASLVSLIGLATQGKLPVAVAVWTPNAVLFVVGLSGYLRLERPGDRDLIGTVRGALQGVAKGLGRSVQTTVQPEPGAARPGFRFPLLLGVMDGYVVGSFLFYFVALLLSFVLITHVFTFFELLGDVLKNKIPIERDLLYHAFLTPQLLYEAAPLAVLVATLVSFGIMAKNNETTALKACGISLRRLAVPVLVTASVLSLILFAFDYSFVPQANRIQDAIRAEIKGRPAQTYFRPERAWIFGNGSRIYHYRYFDATLNQMLGVHVYEIDPKSFHVTRHISAERAVWEPRLNTWIFQNGWSRRIEGLQVTSYESFADGARTFTELREEPGWFRKEVIQSKQMNYPQLASYIRELQQSGFDTVRLQVQFHKKFATPVFALIMALISVPFAFKTGNRGAMAGVGVSLGVAIAYWAVNNLFEQVGNLNQLPPTVAAWAPDGLFALAGVYLMGRMRT